MAMEDDLQRAVTQGLSFLHLAICDRLGTTYLGSGLDGFDNGVFALREYDWADRDEDDPAFGLPNFEYKDFSVDWYKHIGRSMTVSHDIPVAEFVEMMARCLQSLIKT